MKIAKFLFTAALAFSAFTLQAADTKGVHELTDQDGPTLIQNGVVIVDFYASWCGPCQRFGPVFEEFGKELAEQGGGVAYKANVDVATKFKKAHKVTRIPTIVAFKDGKEVTRRTGGQSIQALWKMVHKAQNAN